MWSLPAPFAARSGGAGGTFGFLFDQLNVGDTAPLVDRFITAPAVGHGDLAHEGALAEDDPDAGE